MRFHRPLFFGLLTLILIGGCQPGDKDSATNNSSEKNGSSNSGQSTGIVKKSIAKKEQGKKELDLKKDSDSSNSEPNKGGTATKIVKKSFVSGSSKSFSTSSFGGGGSSRKTSLTQAVLQYANESQESNPTSLVWLFDQTQSATKLRDQVISEIKDHGKESADKLKVEMAVAGFTDKGIETFMPDPTTDGAKLIEALDKIAEVTSDREGTFAALNATISKYEYLRKTAKKTVILVLVTDEAGDDASQTLNGKKAMDEVTDRLTKLGIPLFAIGYAAPFGRETDLVEGVRSETTYGPETVYPERISLAMWNGSTEIFRYDSGFGPWNLEKVCRASGGRFLADRPARKSMRLVSKMQSNWPAVTSRQFSDSAMSAYKPFYGSTEEYLADVNSNKAKLALHNAAKLGHTKVFRMQDYEFRATDEAAMSRQINMTQRIPAVIRPGLEKLFDILKEGEKERDKLTSKRWQASFDLAYGRTMANYVRVIGLNSMMAELKGGKSFTDASNNSWMLLPDEDISTGTSNQKMADKAKMYLQRVIDDHPDTPWALIAQKELESPMGWRWQETKR